ncbi:hypothetical protein GCM10008012_33660 [Rhizobium anhuiense]|nr:hypothetical protein GCM10008012_33660 [Rhizobium anhuiense]
MEPVGNLFLEGVLVRGVDLLDGGDQGRVKVALHPLPDIVSANIVKARADRDDHRHQGEGNDNRDIAAPISAETAEGFEEPSK